MSNQPPWRCCTNRTWAARSFSKSLEKIIPSEDINPWRNRKIPSEKIFGEKTMWIHTGSDGLDFCPAAISAAPNTRRRLHTEPVAATTFTMPPFPTSRIATEKTNCACGTGIIFCAESFSSPVSHSSGVARTVPEGAECCTMEGRKLREMMG